MVKPQPAGFPARTWYWFGHATSANALAASGRGSRPGFMQRSSEKVVLVSCSAGCRLHDLSRNLPSVTRECLYIESHDM